MRITLLSLAFATALGCGTPPVAPTHAEVGPAASASARTTEKEAPLSAAPEPEGLVLVARATQSGSADLQLLGVPPLVTSASRFAQSTRELEELVDASGAYEFAWVAEGPESVLSRQFTAVVSIPLTSFHEARSRMLQLRQGSDDEINRAHDGNIVIEGSYGACTLGRALGPSPARIVCAGTRHAVDKLAAYALTTLPTHDFGGGSAVLELFPSRAVKGKEEQWARVARLLSSVAGWGSQSSDRLFLEPMLETVLPELVDLSGDVEKGRFALEESAGDVVISGRLELGRARSWSARTLADVASQPDAREMFFRLPESSTLAWFSSGPREARVDEARKSLSSWLKNYMGPKFRAETSDLIASTFLPRAPMVYGQGDLVDSDARDQGGGKRIYDKTLSTYGWHVMGYAEKAALYERELDRGMNAYNSGDLRNFAYRELSRLCPGLTKITRRPALGGLPRGSVLYEMRLPGKFFDDCANRYGRSKGPPAPAASLSVILVPDGNVTWIGLAAEEAILRKQLATVISKKDTLARDASLEALKGGDAKLGGFVSLAGLGGLERFLSMDDYVSWSRPLLSARPNKGKTRMPYRFDVSRSGERSTLSLSARMPRGMAEDIRQARVDALP